MKTNTALPIILIHKGDSYYLANTIAQAHSSNPDSDIILIGDKSNAYYSGIKHFNYLNYFNQAKKLESIFEPINCPGHYKDKNTQRFIFQKWLVLREFLEKENIPECLLIDSDVLLFSTTETISNLHPHFELTVNGGIYGANPGTTLIRSTTILDELNQIIFSFFTDPSVKQELIQRENEITEMDALGMMLQKFPEKVGNNYNITNNVVIQNSMLEPNRFDMENGVQKIYWKNNLPFGKTVAGETVQFLTLHFHGSTKKIMHRYLKLKGVRARLYWIWNSLRFKLLKYPKRYSNLLFSRELYPKALG